MGYVSYEKLFKLLDKKGLTRTELTKLSGISTNMMAKLGKGESVHISVLCKICKTLNCGLDDIVEIL